MCRMCEVTDIHVRGITQQSTDWDDVGNTIQGQKGPVYTNASLFENV